MIERFDPQEFRSNYTHHLFRQDHILRYLIAKNFIRRLGTSHDRVIVDAASGCGYGYQYLKELGNYIGIDRSLETVVAAHQKYPGANYIVRDIERYGELENIGKIDIIVSFETAEHLKDPDSFLRRSYSILSKSEGYLLFSVPTSLTRDFDPYHIHDRSAEEWRDTLRRCGFAVIDEISMPFTTTFREFVGTIPTTLQQKGKILRFLLTHWKYLINRIWMWGLRGRFYWESTLFICAAMELEGNGTRTPGLGDIV